MEVSTHDDESPHSAKYKLTEMLPSRGELWVGSNAQGGRVDALWKRLETECAQRPEALAPTPFTSRCAELWVAIHGRRFNVYTKQRESRKRKRGNGDKALHESQTKALEALFQNAEYVKPDCNTVLGVRRHKLLQDTSQAPADGTSMAKFREFTETKRQESSMSAAAPKKRLGNVFMQRRAPAFEYGTKRTCLVGVSGLALASTDTLRICFWDCVSLGHVSVLVVESVDDLATKSSWGGLGCEDCALMLVACVAYGWTVVERRHWSDFANERQCPLLQHRLASQVKSEIAMTKKFEQKHRKFAHLFRSISKVNGSKWTVRITDDVEVLDDKTTRISKVADALVFARALRRLKNIHAGISGAIFTV